MMKNVGLLIPQPGKHPGMNLATQPKGGSAEQDTGETKDKRSSQFHRGDKLQQSLP
jgi:hypothetical protein